MLDIDQNQKFVLQEIKVVLSKCEPLELLATISIMYQSYITSTTDKGQGFPFHFEEVSTHVKLLTQFLYSLGIESVEDIDD